ncbi:MAG: zinc metallopeptidase [Pirellulaceae bacterium]|nr:zinc metallopeptidase [Pirellulaceae bacterium]
MFFFDPKYLLFIAPALILALWAKMRLSATYAQAQRIPASLSGAAAARLILDSAGLQHVAVEAVPGHLSDHYDPSHKVLRLSQDVYQNRSAASVGIAAHEAGHALQDAEAYAPLVIRNAAVPLARFGGGTGIWMIVIGALLHAQPLVLLGILLFGCVAFFQIVNLPVEFNASSRAKAQLVQLGIINREELVYVNKVLGAAAWTYVAATLEAVLILLYYIYRFTGSSRD